MASVWVSASDRHRLLTTLRGKLRSMLLLSLLVYITGCEPFGPGGGDTGGLPPSKGRLLVLPSELDFGTNAVLDAAPGKQSVSARNTGGSLLVVAGLDRVVGQDAVFKTNAPALVELQPNEALEIEVTFTPLTSGVYEGWLVPNGEEQVRLTGQGVAPVANLTPASLDLGSHAIGCGAQGELTLSNSGDEDLQIVSTEISSGFSMNVPTTQTLQPGDLLLLAVLSAPITGGLYQGTAQVRTNDPFQPVVSTDVEFLAYEGAGVIEEFIFIPNTQEQMTLSLTQQPVESTLRVESNGRLLSAWTWYAEPNELVVDGNLESLEDGDPLTLQYLSAMDCSR
jgi:hypothetical protein